MTYQSSPDVAGNCTPYKPAEGTRPLPEDGRLVVAARLPAPLIGGPGIRSRPAAVRPPTRQSATRVCVCSAVFIVAGGCGVEGEPNPPFVSRACSGGSGGANDSEWRLADAPTLDLGSGAGNDVFHAVTSAVRLSNGHVVIASGGDHALKVVTERGVLVQHIGREGRGPREFTNAPWVGRFRADSLLVWDSGRGRVSVFTADGALVRDRQATGMGLTPNALGLFADGSLVVDGGFRTRGLSALTPGLRRDSTDLYVIASDSSSRQPFVRLLGPERYVSTSRGTLNVSPAPFGRSTLVAVGDALAALGDNGGRTITIVDRNGRLRRSIDLEAPDVSLTADDITRYKEQRVDAVTRPGYRAELKALLDEVPFPSSIPPFTRLQFGADNQLWVEQGAAPSASHSRWVVFDSLGVCAAIMRLPGRYRLLDVGSSWVLILARDEVDAEHVQLYGIVK